MNDIATAEPVRFNPFGEEFRRDPYAVYARLRSQQPMHRVMGTWVLTRHCDVAAVLKDRRFSSALFPQTVRKNKPDFGEPHFDPVEAFMAKAIVFTENPDHARLRHLVNPCFGALAIEAERPMIERVVDELILAALSKTPCDGIGDIADLVPLHVTAERIGLPRAAFMDIRDWVHEIRQLLDPGLMTRADYCRTYSALHGFLGLLRTLLPQRRAKPGPDLISQLLAARHSGDRLTDDEIMLSCIMSFVAGTETTKFLIGNGMLALLQHPQEMQRLRVHPRWLGNTIEEVLRYDAPLQQTKRVALADVQLGGTTVHKGEQVLLCLAAANRDPALFPEPNRFDIARANSNAHVGFGHGMRGCLGATMASLEAQVVFERLFMRDLHVQLCTTQLQWQTESRILRGLSRMPLKITRASTGAGAAA
jgi:cytochrome P450